MSVRLSCVPRPGTRGSALRAGAAVAALAGGLVLATAGPVAAEPPFGTAPVAVEPSGPPAVGTITSVTVGRHGDFDRVVFVVSGPTLAYQVRYVEKVTQDGSGAVVPLAGSAALLVTLRHTEWTERPSPVVNRSPGYPGLRQLRSAGEFEAVATYGIGQATRAGFRAFRLTGPDRIVVDVRHPRVATTTPPGTATSAAASPGTSPGTGSATPGGAGDGDPSGTAGTAAGTGTGGELAETGTGTGTDPVLLAIIGGLLALAGLVAVGIGVHVTRRPVA